MLCQCPEPSMASHYIMKPEVLSVTTSEAWPLSGRLLPQPQYCHASLIPLVQAGSSAVPSVPSALQSVEARAGSLPRSLLFSMAEILFYSTFFPLPA